MEQFRPPHEVQRDAELAVALRDGDDEAVRTLYDRFGGLVFAVTHWMLGDRQRAEDVTLHVFLQAWRNADHFEAGRDFAPWLATIARRAAIEDLRNEQRRPAAALEHANPSDSGPLPPSADQIEKIWGVRTAIDSLSPDERKIVRSQHLGGQTHMEITEELGSGRRHRHVAFAASAPTIGEPARPSPTRWAIRMMRRTNCRHQDLPGHLRRHDLRDASLQRRTER